MTLRILALLCWSVLTLTSVAQPLPGTALLTGTNDFAADMVGGIKRYLDREMTTVQNHRAKVQSYPEASRARFRELLGLSDPRDERGPVTLRYVAAVSTNLPIGAVEVARGAGYRVFAVVWNVMRGVEGEGLLLLPERESKGDVIALPDCDWTPEQLAGLAPGLKPLEQLARLCAEQGFRVIVPALIDRGTEFAGNPSVRPMKQSQRETLWRASYEMGRTVIGYELQKVFAAADWLNVTRKSGSLGIVGYGEGGLLAYYAGAMDARLALTYVSGYFAPRERLWEEPIYRNVFGLVREFGDAEIGALVTPRMLFIEHGRYPDITHTDANGGAPGRIGRPDDGDTAREFARLQDFVGTKSVSYLNNVADRFGDLLEPFLASLGAGTNVPTSAAPQVTGTLPDAKARTLRQYRQLLEDTQWLMREGDFARKEYWKKADFKSAAGFTNSSAWYREQFRTNVIGVIPPASLPPTPRSRFLGETNGVRRYEVVLEVHPDLFAHGILCVPTGIKAGERRPVVACQHGLEGRPTDISDPAVNNPAYGQYGLRLAERGFITFAPQNPYIGSTRFRQVLHQAQPLGLTLWSFIVRQHEVITDWLAAQEFSDPERIAFYGLSYGGKTAMRVPLLVQRYCLSICSADYNEWIWKTTSARASYSYLFNNEYDMPEWNLGNTFNYAELSWLIFPRPFMVERGHEDGVAPDEWVAYEYAKTRRHYDKLGLGDRTEIEFFNGPHSIHGVGTFEFLGKHLQWRKR